MIAEVVTTPFEGRCKVRVSFYTPVPGAAARLVDTHGVVTSQEGVSAVVDEIRAACETLGITAR
jgi:hypothetical protein